MDINAEQFDKKEKNERIRQKKTEIWKKEIEKFWKWLDGKELFC